MRIPLVVALICAVAALTVACGGDDDKATNTPGAVATTGGGNNTPAGGSGTEDLDQYFRDLAERFDLSRQASDAATGAFHADLDAATTLDGQKQVINDFLDNMVVVFNDSIIAMNEMSVPVVAQAPHFAFRDDIVKAKGIVETLKDDIANAETADEAQAVVDDFNTRVVPLVIHAEAACRDLQDIANEKNIDVALGCKAE